MSGDTCDCLVCAVRRWMAERYPAGSDQEAAMVDVGTQLGGVLGTLSSKSDVAIKAFAIGYAEARVSFSARGEDENKVERGPLQ